MHSDNTMGVTCLKTVDSNAGVRDRERGAQKMPEQGHGKAESEGSAEIWS